MKRKGNILEQTASNQNIILAWMDVCKNRHNSPNAVERFASYEENLERNLNEVQEIIINGNWTDISVFSVWNAAKNAIFLLMIRCATALFNTHWRRRQAKY